MAIRKKTAATDAKRGVRKGEGWPAPELGPAAPGADGKVIGAMVVLNSGGPAMTVIGEQARHVQCAWFREDGTSDTAVFPRACVRLVGVPARKRPVPGQLNG
jgi:uncharacterized protein YodC (DUF2158 family)